jgi:hypothetical protein
MDMDIEFNKLNDDWISNFEKTDKLYQDFYKDDVYYVNLKYVYINRSNEIEKINQESFLMSNPNVISREEILKILKRSISIHKTNYSLLAILRYNINLDTTDVKNFILHPNEYSNYLRVIKNIDALSFEKTIHMFQDLNDLILIFYEKSKELKEVNPNTCTKRVYLTKKTVDKTKRHDKTVKKRYKE